jgi:hypothetical protein
MSAVIGWIRVSRCLLNSRLSIKSNNGHKLIEVICNCCNFSSLLRKNQYQLNVILEVDLLI